MLNCSESKKYITFFFSIKLRNEQIYLDFNLTKSLYQKICPLGKSQNTALLARQAARNALKEMRSRRYAGCAFRLFHSRYVRALLELEVLAGELGVGPAFFALLAVISM